MHHYQFVEKKIKIYRDLNDIHLFGMFSSKLCYNTLYMYDCRSDCTFTTVNTGGIIDSLHIDVNMM